MKTTTTARRRSQASNSVRNSHQYHCGLSLLEMTIVIAILAITAAVIYPQLSASKSIKLDLAASEIAAAARFARSETNRTGKEHGLNIQTNNQQIRVYWLDKSGITPVPNYSIRHPVDKKMYTLIMDRKPFFTGISLQTSEFIYRGSATVRQSVNFLPTGHPSYNDGNSTQLLKSGKITLEHKGQQKDIQIIPITGQVVIR